MKHWLVVAGILLFGIAAVVVAERHKVEVQPSPAAVLYLVADTEQELTRMPVSFIKMSDEDEIRLGNGLAESYEMDRELKKKPEVQESERYIAQVGSRLAPHAHRKLPYRFHYIPDKFFINAFALPGGHVFIGAGLIAFMDSEDELAAVIGHEIEHIDHHHCTERAQQQQALRKIPLGNLIALPIELFEAGYSKDQELEADREGTRLAVEAGYSANGAVRMFETFQRLYDESHSRAKTPQQELTQVAKDTIEGYFRSHPLPAERIQQVRTLIASEHWPVRTERDLQIAYLFWTDRSRDALDGHKYREAQQLATRSLQIRPDQPNAIETLARAQFAQADFAGAAASYRKLVDLDLTTENEEAYALSLAAANPHTAASEFASWAKTVQADASSVQVPLAGLALLTGAREPAKNAAELARRRGEAEWLGRLAWWYYLAGDYRTASDLLEETIQKLPGTVEFRTAKAWSDIELGRLADALQDLEGAQPAPGGGRGMARAVALWQAKQPDQALQQFELAAKTQIEWKDSRWVQALYSPTVLQSIQQMQDERERRRKLQLARVR